MGEEPGTDVAVVEVKPLVIKLTDVAIETIAHNIKQAERLVFEVLEEDVDYGRLPGIPQEGLWNPGASKINNAFNTYPDYKVLHHVEEDGLISYTMQSILISRDSQQVVGTGIGAASTREPKYKYRWVPDPKNYGYSDEGIKTLKFKDGKYRILNPEYGELVNTMAKMAAKRADVDAAQSLPGVASALRKLFTGAGAKPKTDTPKWDTFWGEVGALGLSEERVHQMLGVKSMKDWLSSGRSLNQAIEVLSAKLTQEGAAQSAAKTTKRTPDEIKPEDLPDGFALGKVANELWGLQPKTVWDELNYTSVHNFQEAGVESPWDCFLKLKVVRKPPD